MRGTFVGILAGSVLALGAGCEPAASRNRAPDPAARTTAAETAALAPEVEAALGVLAQHAVFFDHASVGLLVMEGVERLATATPGAHPTRFAFEQSRVDPSKVANGIFADHYFVAENGHPLQKMAEFQASDLVASSLGTRLDGLGGAALMKLCFADFDSPGITTTAAVTEAFQRYQATMSQLEAQFPAVRFIHVTSALRSEGNELREQYNDLVRSAYASTGRVFDLADVESNGHRDASAVRVMDPAFNDGSDHPNVAGQDALATALVLHLAGVFRPTVSSLTVSPALVVGGDASTGTVTLSGPAPAGGTVVALASDNLAAETPATATVPAGATTATFPVSTHSVAEPSTATLTASCGGSTRTAALAVKPVPGLASLSVNPSSVVGGGTTTGTVTLTGPAPLAGVAVGLASSDPSASAPTSVTVPGGATSATFPVATTAVGSAMAVTLTASHAGVSQTAPLAVIPPPPLPALLSVVLDPATLVGGEPSTGTVTLSGAAPVGGLVVALASDRAAASPPLEVNVAEGASTATFSVATTVVAATESVTVTASLAGASQAATLTVVPPPPPPSLASVALDPITVIGGWTSTGTVTLSRAAPAGGVVVGLASDSAVASVPPSVVVAAGLSSATFPVTTAAVAASTLATITATLSGQRSTATLAVTPAPKLSAVALSPASVVGGTASTGTVTLTSAAPPGGALVALASSRAAAVVPPSVLVAAGTTSATFPVVTAVVTSSTTATLTATYAGLSRSASLSIARIAVASVSLEPASVPGGSPSTGTVRLNTLAPAAGFRVTLSSSRTSAATVPSSVTVAPGSSAATFPVATSPVTVPRQVTISAAGGGATKTSVLSVTVATPTPTLSSVALSPATVVGGETATGTVTLSSAAPTGGLVVGLASGDATATVPSSVTVSSGSRTATFPVTTAVVAVSTNATVTASLAGVIRTAALAVTPPPPPPTLASLVVSPATVVGGGTATGTVTLTSAAPAGGLAVGLASSDAVATVPSGVAVSEGATSATFTVPTAAVGAATSATVTASYAGVDRTAVLSVVPVPPVILAQDPGFPLRNVYGWTTGSKSFSFTTPGANRLVVVAIAYTNYFAAAATAHAISGTTLTWTRITEVRTDANSSFVSLWYAWVPAAGPYSATFVPGVAPPYDAFLTVHSFSGSSATGVGASTGASGAGSLPGVPPMVTGGLSSHLLAVGYYDNSTSPTVDASSTRTALDVSSGPAFWTQRTTSTVPPGTYAVGLTAPAAPHSWAMAAAELRVAP